MSDTERLEAVWGAPPAELAPTPRTAIQVSPLVLGSTPIERLADGSLGRFVVHAPPGVLERRYALAHALRALAPGGELLALAPKARGGSRLKGELEAFGCAVAEDARRHHRICRCLRPEAPAGLEAAIAAGGPQLVESLGLISQPGVFSWDRLDEGTARLIAALPPLAGRGVDFGCGVGVLGQAVLKSPAVRELLLVDLDRRAVEAARRNLPDPRAHVVQGDVRELRRSGVDFVVMNPPFHHVGREAIALGADFIRAAAAALRPGGACWLVANATLPYEPVLATAFARVELRQRAGGYKVIEARR